MTSRVERLQRERRLRNKGLGSAAPDTWAHPLPDNNLVTSRKAESCDAIQTACPPWPKDVACGVALSISHSLDSSTQTVIGR